jgi:SAM-dependent methyltransferase
MEDHAAERFANVYEDTTRAAAYAMLEYPGTYYLAFRDLPAIISEHVSGTRALDFGCGTGRSTRFLKRLGFDAIGVDISKQMIEFAGAADPGGTYLWTGPDGADFPDVDGLDLILCAFPFDNIPGDDNRRRLLVELRRLLSSEGRLILLGSTPEIYWHEWASFTTKNFPANREARSGDPVRIVMKDVVDARPVVDLLWKAEDYLELFANAQLTVLTVVKPLGRIDELYEWVSETSVPPWVIYVLARQ